MNDIKLGCCFVYVAVLCGLGLVAGGPVDQVPNRRAAGQQGTAVLFFVAHHGHLRDILFNPIIFNEVLVNQGSAYDNHTGVFTAPLAGVYQFVFVAQLCRGNHNNRWYFMTNNQQMMLCHAQVSGGDTNLKTCYYMEELKKGDRMWMKQVEGSCAWANTVSKTITFSGVLLASEGVSMVGGRYDPAHSCPLASLSRSVVSKSTGWSIATMWSTVAVNILLCLVLLN